MLAPEDTADYQARVRAAYADLALRHGDWVGEDIPVPQAAITILHPNVMLSRRYTNIITGYTATVLIVQCTDARDMGGHYPPICYPNQGWIMAHKERIPVDFGERHFEGMQYEFHRNTDDAGGLVVRNFMILPDGRIEPDIDAVRKSTTVRRRFYGAGQMQVITTNGIPDAARDAIFRDMIDAHEPVITAILSAMSPSAPDHFIHGQD